MTAAATEAEILTIARQQVWEDGTGGYRSEEIIVVTEDGYTQLTDYPYDPYGVGR